MTVATYPAGNAHLVSLHKVWRVLGDDLQLRAACRPVLADLHQEVGEQDEQLGAVGVRSEASLHSASSASDQQP